MDALNLFYPLSERSRALTEVKCSDTSRDAVPERELARDDGETGEQNERERAAYFFLRRIVFFALVAV